MSVVVIVPPAPIVTPADIAGSHAPNDATVAALIQAAMEEIDGPSGWVGRCFGPQTLEVAFDQFPLDVLLLPYWPLIEVVSVKYDDANGVEQTISPGAYRRVDERSIATANPAAWPMTTGKKGGARVRYRAGYQEGVTGKVPERARQAVILGVRALMGLIEQRMLRSSQVEGIGTRSFVGADVASAALRTASDRLLSTLRVYA